MHLWRSALWAFATSALLAQSPGPAFEVASVKSNHSGSNSSHSDWDNGRIRSTNVSLKRLIATAWRVHEDQISGPDWLATERFDVSAKAESSVKDEQLMLMLQTLLVDRFSMAMHRETRELRGYALVVTKSGSKLKRARDDGNARTRTNNGRLTAEHTSMATLAEILGRHTGLRIVDGSGLNGVFDFTLEWDRSSTSLDDKPPDDTGPSIFTALQEQLGLKLEARKMPVEVLVIDRAQKTPAEN